MEEREQLEGFDCSAGFAPLPEKPVSITGVWLRRKGDQVVVAIEVHGYWVELVSEHYEGNFSHIVEPSGMRRRIAEACESQSYAELAASGGIEASP